MTAAEVIVELPGSWKQALSAVIPDADEVERVWVAERTDGPGPDSVIAATADGVYIAKVPPSRIWPEVVFFDFDEIRAVQSNLGATGAHSEVYIFTPYAPRPGFGLFDSLRSFDRRGHRFAEPNLISFSDPEVAEDLVQFLEARI